MKLTRRDLMGAAGAAMASPQTGRAAMPPNRFEGKDTPKICLISGDGGRNLADEAAAQRIKQLGVNYVIASAGGGLPWTEERLKAVLDGWKSYGLTVGNIMISGFNKAIYARPGRDQDIEKVIQSVRAAGKAGLPVVEYNWYAHRAMEGYFEETGRAGAGWTGFDYELVQTAAQQYQTRPEEKGKKFKDLAPLPEEGAHTLDEMWGTITYFLKAVVPEAEKA